MYLLQILGLTCGADAWVGEGGAHDELAEGHQAQRPVIQPHLQRRRRRRWLHVHVDRVRVDVTAPIPGLGVLVHT